MNDIFIILLTILFAFLLFSTSAEKTNLLHSQSVKIN